MQSKISHIFAGVPIPRKRKHLFDSSEQKKDESPALLNPQEDEFAGENSAVEQAETEPQMEQSVREETGAKESLAEESREVSSQDLQAQIEEKEIEPEISEGEEEFSVHAEQDEEFSEEQFTAVEDSEPELESRQHSVEKSDVEQESIDVSQLQSQAESVGEDVSFEKLLSPHPRTRREPEVTMPATPEPKADKATTNDIPAPPVKEPTVEKPLPGASQKQQSAESQGSPDMQNLLIGKIPGRQAVKKTDFRTPRKISAKPAARKLKSKSDADQARQKAMLALAIILAIVLVLVLGKNNISSFLGSGSSGVVEQAGPVTTVTRNVRNVKIDWPEPPVYPDSIRDPMSLEKTVAAAQTNDNTRSFIVKGISYVDGRYLVLVDTDLLTVGDEVHGARITKITENSVEFERDGNVWTQKVGE